MIVSVRSLPAIVPMPRAVTDSHFADITCMPQSRPPMPRRWRYRRLHRRRSSSPTGQRHRLAVGGRRISNTSAGSTRSPTIEVIEGELKFVGVEAQRHGVPRTMLIGTIVDRAPHFSSRMSRLTALNRVRAGKVDCSGIAAALFGRTLSIELSHKRRRRSCARSRSCARRRQSRASSRNCRRRGRSSSHRPSPRFR